MSFGVFLVVLAVLAAALLSSDRVRASCSACDSFIRRRGKARTKAETPPKSGS